MEDDAACKPSRRSCAAAAASSAGRCYALQGAAVNVWTPDAARPRRRELGEGTPPASAHVGTHLRVMCAGTGGAPDQSFEDPWKFFCGDSSLLWHH